MASIEEVRAGIAQANEKASESLNALQNAQASLEQAQNELQRITEGSSQSDVNEANNMLATAVSGIGDVQQAVQAAIKASEGVASRL
jgi:hypothetical protein